MIAVYRGGTRRHLDFNNGMSSNVTNLSVRQSVSPNVIMAQTGWMDVCENCERPFRRLGDRTLCGCCSPALGKVHDYDYK